MSRQVLFSKTDAIRQHFDSLKKTYGKQFAINLAEQSGKEAQLVGAYRSYTEGLHDPEVKSVFDT